MTPGSWDRMGDVRFTYPLKRLGTAPDRRQAIARATTDDLIMALAATTPAKDPLLMNVIATELQNRTGRALAVAENIAEGVCTVDEQGHLTYVNPTAERMLGRRAEDILGLDVMEAAPLLDEAGRVLPPDERPSRVVLRDGMVETRENLFLLRADGTRVAVAIVSGPIRADGAVVGAVVAMRDVSAQRAVEADLRFHRRLLDAVGEAVIATRPDGTILYWSRSAESLYGWPAEEVLGRNIVDVSPSEASREAAEDLMDALRRGETWTGTFPLRRKDGSRFLGRVTDAPVLDEKGRLVAIIGVSREEGA